jgi:TolB-like protein
MGDTLAAYVVISIFAVFARSQASRPTTQPANAAPAEGQPKAVLVLPFTAPSDPKYKDTGRAIQQDLANAMAGDLRGRVNAPTTAAPAADAQAALAAARDADAAAVVFGQVQVNEDEIRLTGQVLDAGTGKSLGSLKQSGPIDTLFHLEDELAPEAVAALPQPLLNLRGLLSARQSTRPQIIYLPGDAPTPQPAQGPIDGGYAGPFPPYTLPPPPGGSPPYSPNAGSYPYRFIAPYAHLFSYDFDPDPFLPIYGGFYPDRFGPRGPVQTHAGAGAEEARQAAHRR